MLYAAMGTLPRNSPVDIDLALAETRKAPGVVHVISRAELAAGVAGGARPDVAVVARGYWLARHALARLLERCGGPAALATVAESQGPSCPSRVTRATAHFVENRLRLWLATADMAATRALAARLAGIAEEYVDVRVIGEAEDAAPVDIISAALTLARELRPAPVQVVVVPMISVPMPAASRAALETPADAASGPREALAA
jgi:hypothetical protein